MNLYKVKELTSWRNVESLSSPGKMTMMSSLRFLNLYMFFFVHRFSPQLPDSTRPFSCAFSTNIHPKKTPASVRKVPVLEVCDKVSLLSKIVHICISLHGQASAQRRQNDTISDNILWYFSLFCKIEDTHFFKFRDTHKWMRNVNRNNTAALQELDKV